uniref:phage tail protein n=1 Tax=Clostridium sp. TaxID=1506 RepID=UPI00261A706E
MAETYYSILTSIGKAKIANAAGLGNKINFVTMKVGDGNGSYYNPTESQTDLVHTVWQGNITQVAIDEDNSNWINIEVLIPPSDGGFFIREYGVFDSDGNMIAVAKCAETYKPLPADGGTKEITMKMVLAISNTSSITLKIDPTIIFAKKSEVETVQSQVNTISTEVQNARGTYQNLKARLDASDTQLSDIVINIKDKTNSDIQQLIDSG